jgi:hypothetical protein
LQAYTFGDVSTTRELVVAFLTTVASRLDDVARINSGRDQSGEAMIPSLHEQALRLRDVFADGGAAPLARTDAEPIRELAMAIEGAKPECSTEHLREDLQFESDYIHEFLMNAGAQPVDRGWKFVN